jgi:hypothetical protein
MTILSSAGSAQAEEYDTSLDDLLHRDASRRRPRARDSWRAWALKRLLFGLPLAAALTVFLRLAGIAFPYLVVFALTGCLMIVRRCIRDLGDTKLPRSLRSVAPSPHETFDVDGLAAAASRWDIRLDWTDRDPDRFDRTVRPALADLVLERIRQKYGIVAHADPVQARQIMGEALWQSLYAPLVRNPTPAEVASMISLMESL